MANYKAITPSGEIKEYNTRLSFFQKTETAICNICGKEYPTDINSWRSHNHFFVCVACKKNINKEAIIRKNKREKDSIKKTMGFVSKQLKTSFLDGLKPSKYRLCILCGKNKEINHFNFTKNGNICCECCEKKNLSYTKLKRNIVNSKLLVYCDTCGVKYPHTDEFFYNKRKTFTCKKCISYKYQTGKLPSKYPDKIRKKISYFISKIQDRGAIRSILCNRCGLILPADSYYFDTDSRKSLGLRHICKRCSHVVFGFGGRPPGLSRDERLLKQKKWRRSKALWDMRHNVDYADEVLRDGKYLQVKCKYCDRWFIPTNRQVEGRTNSLLGRCSGESSFYCSSGCKLSCPTFGTSWKEKTFKIASSRESNPILRKIVLKRDGYKCVNCGASGKKVQLHCHHVVPATQNPMTANDPSSCVILCVKCHKEVHRKSGCKYHELRCGAAAGV